MKYVKNTPHCPDVPKHLSVWGRVNKTSVHWTSLLRKKICAIDLKPLLLLPTYTVLVSVNVTKQKVQGCAWDPWLNSSSCLADVRVITGFTLLLLMDVLLFERSWPVQHFGGLWTCFNVKIKHHCKGKASVSLRQQVSFYRRILSFMSYLKFQNKIPKRPCVYTKKWDKIAKSSGGIRRTSFLELLEIIPKWQTIAIILLANT